MANYQSANVIHVDTDNYQYSGPITITGVKFIAGTSSSITIRGNAASDGPILYYVDGSADIFEDVQIRDSKGIWVDVVADGQAYIYLQVC